MYELSPEVIAREVAENRANEHLLHLIPKDVLSKALSQYYCEIESDFLCFALPYEAVAECIPATIPVIDFGCYMAAQAYFFRNHPAYVGVDCYEMREDFSSLRRFSLPNCRHCSRRVKFAKLRRSKNANSGRLKFANLSQSKRANHKPELFNEAHP